AVARGVEVRGEAGAAVLGGEPDTLHDAPLLRPGEARKQPEPERARLGVAKTARVELERAVREDSEPPRHLDGVPLAGECGTEDAVVEDGEPPAERSRDRQR